MTRIKQQNHLSINDKKWLTLSELQSYLGFGTYEYFKKLRDSGELPYYQVGKMVMFQRSEIDNWIQSKKVQSSVNLAI